MTKLQKKVIAELDELIKTDSSKGIVDAYNVVAAELVDPNNFIKHVNLAIEHKRMNKTWSKKIQDIIQEVQ